MRKHLSTSIMLACSVFAFLMILGIGAVGYFTYSNEMTDSCQKYIAGVLGAAKTQINVDDLENCLKTGIISEQYNKTHEFLDTCKVIYDIKYIYIMKPLNDSAEDNMQYAMIGITEEEAKNGMRERLGALSGSEYSPEVARFYIDALHGGDKISYYANTTSFGYMYTGLVPLYNSKNEPVLVLSVDILMDAIYATRKRYVVTVAAFGIVLLVLFLIGIASWMSKRVTRPIAKLEQAAREYVKNSRGNSNPDTLTFKVPAINTKDEIESLYNSLINMSEDLKKYMHNLMLETQEKERIESELSIARNIQADMLPKNFRLLSDRNDVEIYASMDPAKEVGGDFYDFFMIDENHLCIVIADVSGKGVPAALFMVVAKTLIKNHMQSGETISKALTETNNQLSENNDEMLFVTAWLGVLDLTTREVEYCDAGHEAALLIHENGTVETIKAKKKYPPLATMEGTKYATSTFSMVPGDKLFIYTDGVPEATDKNDKLYGMSRLKNLLESTQAENPKTLLSLVRSDVDKFVGDAPQFDDLTMLSVQEKV